MENYAGRLRPILVKKHNNRVSRPGLNSLFLLY